MAREPARRGRGPDLDPARQGVADRDAPPVLPAWSARRDSAPSVDLTRPAWSERSGRKFGSATGRGVRICLVDSGIEPSHPLVGEVDGWYAVVGDDDEKRVVADDSYDEFGHGTACASIIRGLAPECSITSLRVFGSRNSGHGLLEALRWAIDERFSVVNVSLSTKKLQFLPELYRLCDRAYFRNTVIVAAAHNLPVLSFPWRLSSVLSVGSHDGSDPFEFFYNPAPPVEFYARGVDVEVGWKDGEVTVQSGNSFAAPHVAAFCALLLDGAPELRPFQVKTELFSRADNVRHGHSRPLLRRSSSGCGHMDAGPPRHRPPPSR